MSGILTFLWTNIGSFIKNNPTQWSLCLYLPAATKLGQGNVFTGICDSIHRGGVCLSACWDTTPGADTPLGADTPPEQTPPPRSRHPPGLNPPTRYPLGPGTHRPGTPPTPRKQTPAYGQWAAGTHPTGMHSCDVIMSIPLYFTTKYEHFVKDFEGLVKWTSNFWNQLIHREIYPSTIMKEWSK